MKRAGRRGLLGALGSSVVASAAAAPGGGGDGGGGSGGGGGRGTTAELAAELAALVRPSDGGDNVPSSERIAVLIQQLEIAGAPVDVMAFEGAWEVVWSEGTMAWRALVATAVQAVAGRSRAGQSFHFDASPPEALNFAELFGGATAHVAHAAFPFPLSLTIHSHCTNVPVHARRIVHPPLPGHSFPCQLNLTVRS